jgi:hypothetical protein
MKLLPIYGGIDAGVRPVAREQVHAAVGMGMRPVDIVRQIARALDDIAAKCVKPACARGCGWCCHQRVDVTAPEVFALAEHLRGMDLEPLRATVESLRGLSSREHHLRRVRCALLNGQMECTAHSERPLACRRGHSLDAAICRAVYDDPALETQIPVDSTLSWNTAALILGFREGYAHHERALDTYELNAALLIALEDETCEARWMAGEDPLAEARTHDAAEIARLLR